MNDLRLSDTLEVHEIAALFFRVQKEERNRHQSIYKNSHKSLLNDNLKLLDEQAWEEMCVFFGWEDAFEFNWRNMGSHILINIKVHNWIEEELGKGATNVSHDNCSWCTESFDA